MFDVMAPDNTFAGSSAVFPSYQSWLTSCFVLYIMLSAAIRSLCGRLLAILPRQDPGHRLLLQLLCQPGKRLRCQIPGQAEQNAVFMAALVSIVILKAGVQFSGYMVAICRTTHHSESDSFRAAIQPEDVGTNNRELSAGPAYTE